MALEYIKRCIRSGMFQEARKLIEKEENIYCLMYDFDRDSNEKLPLLVMLSLIKDEDNALNLSRLLLERGYHVDLSDKNGLCALNYAIALKRHKLVTLLLSSFEFELNGYRDCYKNSFLHYVYAVNNPEIIEQFREIYSKYYEWAPDKFKFILNCDGLSVQDLYEYSLLNKSKENNKKSRLKSSNGFNFTSDYRVRECFKFDSNPIVICKYINQVFNSNSTMKSELMFLSNSTNFSCENSNKSEFLADRSQTKPTRSLTKQKIQKCTQANKEFKINILYQIKSLNKTKKPSITSKLANSHSDLEKQTLDFKALKYISPINSTEHMPRILNSTSFYDRSFQDKLLADELDFQSLKFNNSSQILNSPSWRSDFKQLFLDYTIVNSPSYRTSSAIIRPVPTQGIVENQTIDLGAKINPLTTTNTNNKQTSSNYIVSRPSSSCSQANETTTKLKSPSQSGKLDIFLVPGSTLNNNSTSNTNKIKKQ